ncbi:MAG: tRNA (cytidine(34)-2'-O)-methyltransferase [Chlamydiae bacterium]|nr:tRNA (cytidine(34)-2'-O)-methyltransferase [Chlamydiota bacterium]
MEILLYQPQIPQNTGNIVRTCSVTGTALTLVKPLGFSVASRHLKRAGLDYWEEVNINYIDDVIEYLSVSSRPFYFFSSKASRPYTHIPFTQEDILVFGAETSGLPAILFDLFPEKFYTIPMQTGARCLNLSTSAAIVLYEGLRQLGFSYTR